MNSEMNPVTQVPQATEKTTPELSSSSSASAARTVLLIIGYILAAISLGFGFYGLNFMYDDSYSNQVVGGDAYNFIIYATRGTAYVCAGILCAVLSVFCAVCASHLHSNTGAEN